MKFQPMPESDTRQRLKQSRRARRASYNMTASTDLSWMARPRYNTSATTVDTADFRGMLEGMTPTITQMTAKEPPKVYRLIVRTFKKGLGGVDIFEETTPFTVGNRRRVEEVAAQYLKDPTVQVRVESDNMIVAVGLYGDLLWLSKVPPRKYWLDYRKRPAPIGDRMAACGLPVPERYRQPKEQSSCP